MRNKNEEIRKEIDLNQPHLFEVKTLTEKVTQNRKNSMLNHSIHSFPCLLKFTCHARAGIVLPSYVSASWDRAHSFR